MVTNLVVFVLILMVSYACPGRDDAILALKQVCAYIRTHIHTSYSYMCAHTYNTHTHTHAYTHAHHRNIHIIDEYTPLHTHRYTHTHAHVRAHIL